MYTWPYDTKPMDWLPYHPNKDYCGPDGKRISKYIRPHIFGIDLNLCCWAHDQRYCIGGSEEDREVADKQFRVDMELAIKAQTRPYNPFRYIALIYALRRYHFVVMFGKGSFNYNA